MDDQAIVQLYLSRDQTAIAYTQQKYGGLCARTASRILNSPEDCQECVNDALLAAWNTIPPQLPRRLGAYLSRITRNQALKKYQYLSAEKRRPDLQCSLAELEECLPAQNDLERQVEGRRLAEALSAFLWALPREKRVIFLRRYYFFDSIQQICDRTGFSQAKVTSMLFHLRRRLQAHLTKEDLL